MSQSVELTGLLPWSKENIFEVARQTSNPKEWGGLPVRDPSKRVLVTESLPPHPSAHWNHEKGKYLPTSRDVEQCWRAVGGGGGGGGLYKRSSSGHSKIKQQQGQLDTGRGAERGEDYNWVGSGCRQLSIVLKEMSFTPCFYSCHPGLDDSLMETGIQTETLYTVHLYK